MSPFLNECLSFFSPAHVQALAALCERTYETAQRMNITARRSREEIVFFHIADALSLLSEARRARRVCDVGTGGGFPGLVLAALCPETECVLMDATQKKVDAIAQTAEALGLSNVRAVCARAEEAGRAEHREAYDLVVSRALAALPMLSELCLPLTRVGGTFAAMKGRRAEEELFEAGEILRRLKVAPPTLREEPFSAEEVLRACPSAPSEAERQALLEFSQMRRVTLLFEKHSATPRQYPRPFSQIRRGV